MSLKFTNNMFVGIIVWFIFAAWLCCYRFTDSLFFENRGHMPDEISFLGLTGASNIIYEYFIFEPFFLYITLVIAVKFHVLVCITKTKASQRQCYEIANGLHSYISMQGKFASIKLFS